ncbi:MAG: hypothetical protein E4H14_01840 [Candidatus Thorarchaeota archaeon]|nr:MAG: hypothetical protein E4H14_01840 [Candidatus Thorarchaeota archaeon]
MPFTPYHFGPGLLLGVVLFPFLDFSTMMVASVILDLEPLVVLLLNLPFPLHGFFHTYLGATIIAIILAFALYPMIGFLNKIVSLIGLHQESSFRHILPASIIGTYSHIFLDSFIYPEMNPFFPLLGNPLIGVFPSVFIYSSCIYLGLLGFGVYVVRLLYNQMKPKQVRIEEDVFFK